MPQYRKNMTTARVIRNPSMVMPLCLRFITFPLAIG